MSRSTRQIWRLEGRTAEVEARVADGRATGEVSYGEDPIAFDDSVRRLSSGLLKIGAVRAAVVQDGDVTWVSIDGHTYRLQREEPGARGGAHGGDDDFAASPMTGTLAKLSVAPGDEIAQGGELFVVEAMKMEYVVKAPRDLTVAEVNGAVGEQVEQGAVVVSFASEPDSESSPQQHGEEGA